MSCGALKNPVLVAALLLAPLVSAAAAPARAASPCLDVALVLAVDSSASVSPGEYSLQRQGIAAAFRDPGVLQAVAQAGRVAVSVLYWGSDTMVKPQSDWVVIDGQQDAEKFARMVEATPRMITGDTGLGAAIVSSLAKLDTMDVCAVRKIINVSGDGEETLAVRGKRRSAAPTQARDLAEKMNVAINALAISNEEADLSAYYSENVITGPDAFVMEARNYADFAPALRRKLIREISPQVVSELRAPAARVMRVN